MTIEKFIGEFEAVILWATRIAWRRLHSTHLLWGTSIELSDVHQEVLLSILQGRVHERFDPARGTAKSLLLVIAWRSALRLSIDELFARVTPVSKLGGDDSATSPFAHLARHELCGLAERNLGGIAPLRMEAVLAGLPIWDARTRRPPKQSVNQHRGLRDLRRLLWLYEFDEALTASACRRCDKKWKLPKPRRRRNAIAPASERGSLGEPERTSSQASSG
jgi:hypothetical protein